MNTQTPVGGHDPGARPSLRAAGREVSAVPPTVPTLCICQNGPAIDGYVLRRKDCRAHPPRPEPVEPPMPEMPPDDIDRACAWADYRKEYGVSEEHMAAAHLAFFAGWKAAREGDQSGVLR